MFIICYYIILPDIAKCGFIKKIPVPGKLNAFIKTLIY